VVVLAGIVVLTNQSQQQVSQPAEASADLPAEFIARNVKGSPDAKVVVTEYSDFECPYCKTFAQSTQKQLEEEYIKDGRVRFEYKHFPLPQHNPSATFAALAAECAADQGKFWEMQQYLFQEAGKQGTSTFTQTRLKAMAEALGLDTGEFDQCLSNQEHAQTVQGNMREGQQMGVSATPSIYVNGRKVENPSYAEIKAAIDVALQQQG
jgi:protein-disulfide isomerase